MKMNLGFNNLVNLKATEVPWRNIRDGP